MRKGTDLLTANSSRTQTLVFASSCTYPDSWSVDTDTSASDVGPIPVDWVTAAKVIGPWVVALFCGLEADAPGGIWDGSSDLEKKKTKRSGTSLEIESGISIRACWTYTKSVRDPYWHRERYIRAAPMDLQPD
jgi:hypothetical protein